MSEQSRTGEGHIGVSSTGNYEIKPSAECIENRIYREEFNGKKCKTAILLYCFHTAGVLHIFLLIPLYIFYSLW